MMNVVTIQSSRVASMEHVIHTYDNVTSSYQFQINNYFDQKSVGKLIIVRRLPHTEIPQFQFKVCQRRHEKPFLVKRRRQNHCCVECSISCYVNKMEEDSQECLATVLRCWFSCGFPPLSRKQSNFFCEGKTKTYMSRTEG